jgi:pantoate--beta-alanine ligase
MTNWYGYSREMVEALNLKSFGRDFYMRQRIAFDVILGEAIRSLDYSFECVYSIFMETVRNPRIMRETSKRLLTQGRSIGFVPTMGALHNGHIFLVKEAIAENDITVVSIFVNPTQFGPNEDFAKYPRDMEGDLAKLEEIGVNIIFAPDAHSMYPEGFSTSIDVKGISEKLCGRFRPGHFSGVATVVNKLFNIVMPTRAYFGQKDFQQIRVIETMITDLNMGVELIRCPIIREHDGMAMSSRNWYLSEQERKAATAIYKTLCSAAEMLKSGTPPVSVTEYMNTALGAEPAVSEIQYAGVYDPHSLDDKKAVGGSSLLAVAVIMGNTRLIDNLVIEV